MPPRSCAEGETQGCEGRECEEDTISIDGVNAATGDQIVDWASEHKGEAYGTEHLRWNPLDAKSAKSRTDETDGDGEQHEALVSFAVVPPEIASDEEESKGEEIAETNEEDYLRIVGTATMMKPYGGKGDNEPEQDHCGAEQGSGDAEFAVKSRAINCDQSRLENEVEHPAGEDESVNVNQQVERGGHWEMSFKVVGAAETSKYEQSGGDSHGEIEPAIVGEVLAEVGGRKCLSRHEISRRW